MPRDSKVYLQDMLEAVERIEEYTAGMSEEVFREDPKTVDAVLRNLEVIGEAARGVPESFRVAHPQVPWRKISGLRDILIHQYFGINMDIIWDVLQNQLKSLQAELQTMLKETSE